MAGREGDGVLRGAPRGEWPSAERCSTAATRSSEEKTRRGAGIRTRVAAVRGQEPRSRAPPGRGETPRRRPPAAVSQLSLVELSIQFAIHTAVSCSHINTMPAWRLARSALPPSASKGYCTAVPRAVPRAVDQLDQTGSLIERERRGRKVAVTLRRPAAQLITRHAAQVAYYRCVAGRRGTDDASVVRSNPVAKRLFLRGSARAWASFVHFAGLAAALSASRGRGEPCHVPRH